MRKGLEEFSLLLRRWLVTALWMGMMLYASTDVASGAHTGSTLRQLLHEWGLDLTDATLDTLNLIIRKGAHLTEFAILAILLWRDVEPLLKKRRRFFDLRLFAIVMTLSIGFAILTETIQRFYPSREPSVHDVLINTGGALLGIGLLAVVRPRRRKGSQSVRRILFTSDLHLDQESDALAQLRLAIEENAPDVCVVAGDIGIADRAVQWLEELKEATKGTKLVVCLGNHDHWLDRSQHTAYPTMAEIREKLWRPALAAAGIPCLDFANVEYEDVVLTGGYGHFNLAMQVPGLTLGGKVATSEDYLRGEFAGLVANDMTFLPNAAYALTWEAEAQAKGISNRLEQAVETGKPVIVVTHTAPFAALVAPASSKPKQFLLAYAGNTLVGQALARHRGKIALALCGHTHAHVPFKVVNGIPAVNIGSDYLGLRFVLHDLDKPVQAVRCFRA